MTTYACPNGHQSSDPEWCDTCGAKLGGAPDPAVAPRPAAAAVPVGGPVGEPASGASQPEALAATAAGGAATVACPHCGTANQPDNLFCEQCGYDFTTGQAPPDPQPVAPAPVEEVAGATWVVIIEVDPAWYAIKGVLADQPCPSLSSSTVTLVQRTALVGRTSQSRGVRPEVALDGDTGVSRRHAQFVRDGDVLSIIDLASTNGTYVSAAGAVPDDETEAITASVPTELHDGDRVFLGAWSRLTVRTG